MKFKYAIFVQTTSIEYSPYKDILLRVYPDRNFDTEEEAWEYAEASRAYNDTQTYTVLKVSGS